MDNDVHPPQQDAAGMTPETKLRAAQAQALLLPWSRLGRQLVPLIGEGGFAALFGRSLRLLAPRHDWLSVDPSRKTADALFAAIERDLAGVEPGTASAVNDELMHVFTRQMATLIGPALTARLLADTEQNQQEQKE